MARVYWPRAGKGKKGVSQVCWDQIFEEPGLFLWSYPMTWSFLVGQWVKNLPAMQETQIQSLGWEDPLEKGTATRSRIFAWRIPRTEEPGRLEYMESRRVGHDWVTNTLTFTLSYELWKATEGFKSRLTSFTLFLKVNVRFFVTNTN